MALQPKRPLSAARKDAGKPTVIIVDDDDAINHHLTELLTSAGYTVQCAISADQGLSLIRSTGPGLVLLDIFMPGKDGLEALLELRREFQDLKVLVISGKQHLLSGCSLDIARMLGANGTLAKPFTGVELLRSINNLMAN